MNELKMDAPISIKGIDFEFSLDLQVEFGSSGDYCSEPEPAEVYLSAVFYQDNKLDPDAYANIYSFVEDWLLAGGLDLADMEQEHALDMLLYWEDLN